MHNSKHIVSFFLLGAILLTAPCCARMSVREAQRTVAVADSLRVNEGRLYDDSLALAEAYSTFGRWRYIYPNDYARACYYYGRLLRNRGDQVAAMQAFIAGSHATYVQRVMPLPWFSDYHILGRIYSNMGTMCHLVDEFELSYDMYEQSARFFRKAGDTTLYYYALNSMAFELAEQRLHDETLILLDSIEQKCANTDVLTKLLETKAILYYNLAEYDSAIFVAKQLYFRGYLASTGYVVEAQAYWHLQQYDSALYYAKYVIDSPYASEQDRYHMLYIACNHDTTIDTKTVQELAAWRADINYNYIEPLLQQNSAAVELLRHDISEQPSPKKILLFFIILSLIGIAVGLTFASFRKKIADLFNKHQQLKKENEDICRNSNNIKLQNAAREQQIVQNIENACVIIRQYNNWDEELHWKDYRALCEFVNQHFYLLADKLKLIHHLDEKEVRLSILVLLNMFNNDTIAKILHYGKGIRTYKSRLNAKLGNLGKDLRSKLIQIAISPSQSSDK